MQGRRLQGLRCEDRFAESCPYYDGVKVRRRVDVHCGGEGEGGDLRTRESSSRGFSRLDSQFSLQPPRGDTAW